MNKVNENQGILNSSFFLKLFAIPYIIWLAISIIAMIPDETDVDPIAISDLIFADIILLLIWFLVAFIVSLIIHEIKKVKSKTKIIREIKYATKTDDKIVIEQEEPRIFTADINTKEENSNFNNECLYTCESVINSTEYRKMAKYFPQIYWTYIIWGTILNIIFTAILAIFSKNIIVILIFFTFYQIFLMILYKIRLEYYAEKSFNTVAKKGNIEKEIHIEFYDKFFIRQSKTEACKICYSDIDKCIETDTNFYLRYNKKNMVINIQKDNCDIKLMNFIRKTFKNLENHLGESTKFKGAKKYHNPIFIKRFMIILFVITIASLWGALWSLELINIINPQRGFNFTKNTWVFWCWLPIPLTSIILGFKFRNVGFKCTKNIVVGFIFGFLLLIYGGFCLFPTFSSDYKEINKYKIYIDAILPNNGELEIMNQNTDLDDDKSEYTIINAYYDKEDVYDLVNSIEHSDNWILSKEIKSALKILIPSQLGADDDAYYSIYNAVTNKYNTLPESPGNYEIYAMKYDKSDKQLEIHKFNYFYK